MKWTTTTAYGGDHVDVTPPEGGTATTTYTDARGRTSELRQYHGATPTVLYGPGDPNLAHTREEHVLLPRIAECEQALRAYLTRG